jgi:hypothetical protein
MQMTNREPEHERRKLKRQKVKNAAYVILKPSDTGVGRLIDISMDGLTLDYITSRKPEIQPTKLEIFVNNSPLRLYEIPCKTVTDEAIFEALDGSLSKRRRGIQFGKLTPSQLAQLEFFILNYTAQEE